MASERIADFLRQARENLSREEQLQLAHALAGSPTCDNGTSRRKSLYDALSERGILGSIKDAPPDLGTNPAYLESLGQDD